MNKVLNTVTAIDLVVFALKFTFRVHYTQPFQKLT